MPFTIKHRNGEETPLAQEYRKQIARYERDKDPAAPQHNFKPRRHFPLVEDTVTLSSDQNLDSSSNQSSETLHNDRLPQQQLVPRASEPVTVAERNELGIISVRI